MRPPCARVCRIRSATRADRGLDPPLRRDFIAHEAERRPIARLHVGHDAHADASRRRRDRPCGCRAACGRLRPFPVGDCAISGRATDTTVADWSITATLIERGDTRRCCTNPLRLRLGPYRAQQQVLTHDGRYVPTRPVTKIPISDACEAPSYKPPLGHGGDTPARGCKLGPLSRRADFTPFPQLET